MDCFELLNESVVRIDARGIVRGWNRASERLYGQSRAAALGQHFQQLLDESPCDWHTRHAARDLWDGEVVRRCADGDRRVQLRWSVQRDAAGGVAEIVETGRPAPDLGALRTGLERAQVRYDNLFQALAVAFFEVDFRAVGVELRRLRDEGVADLRAWLLAHPEHVRHLMNLENVLNVNPAAVTLFAAASVADLTGSRSSRLWPDESIPHYVEALMAVLEGRPRYVRETRLRALDGQPLDTLFTVAWSPESVKQGVILIGVIDLGSRNLAFEELKRSEAKYRNLLDAMSVGYIEYDVRRADTLLARYRDAGIEDLARHLLADPARIEEILEAIDILNINAQARRILGVTREGRLPPGLVWMWPRDGWTLAAHAIDGRYRKETLPPAEVRMHRADGTEIDVAIALWSEPDRPFGEPVLCAMIDISERVAAQHKLERLRTEFAHASRLSTLGELAATVAHEISQPLSAIITNVEISQRTLDKSAPGQKKLLHSLGRHTLAAARRAADIVSRIRSIAVPVPPARDVLALNDVVTEALQFVRHELKQAEVRCHLKLADALPCVAGDRIQLQQIIVNLALNATQALRTISDCRCLTIATVATDAGVQIMVEDNGPGFAPGDEQRIFDSFYTTKGDGMGIGLAVCRSIAEHHGGTISARLREKGACFTVTLPRAARSERQRDAAS